MTGDWYLINTAGTTKMVIGPGCRGSDVIHAAEDWLRRGGIVTVSGDDVDELVGRLLTHTGDTHIAVDQGAGVINLAPAEFSATA